MRVLALDLGEKRIGLAVSDPTGILARPLKIIANISDEKVMRAINILVVELEIAEILIGIPLSLSGHRGPQARRTSEFGKALSTYTSIPVRFLDERYSTVQAEKILRDIGAPVGAKKSKLDAVAAAVILQAYLDSKSSIDENIVS